MTAQAGAGVPPGSGGGAPTGGTAFVPTAGGVGLTNVLTASQQPVVRLSLRPAAPVRLTLQRL